MTQKTISVGNGQTVTLTFNKYAPQANGSVMAQLGSTMILATATAGGVDETKDYFPLSVDFLNKLYAGGQVKGGKWSKRDNGGSDADILNSRIIDRSIRPLFPQGYTNEVQVIATLMSQDKNVDAIIVAFLATSVALGISNIPFNGPVSATRVCRDFTGKLIVNPTVQELQKSDLDLLVCTGPAGVNMIEADGQEIPEDIMFQAITAAEKNSTEINDQISAIIQELGQPKSDYTTSSLPTALEKEIAKKIDPLIKEFLNGGKDGDHRLAEEKVITGAKELFADDLKSEKMSEGQLIGLVLKHLEIAFKEKVLTGWRFDGRAADAIRSLEVQTGVLPGAHGSAFFQRGLTQAITSVSLATLDERLFGQNSDGESSKRYMHFYSAMPFSTGEPGRTGRPGRREIGHGALAEKALMAVIPDEQEFPYTLVLTSEILSQNGSSSMASTCGSTMALMDAGVPIKTHVAGVSTGMVSSSDKDFILLTDIAGIEDHFGDMDFKITGTRKGITAIQLDIKRAGLTLDMVQKTLERSLQSRQQILSVMEEALPKHRPNLAPHAPKISMIVLPEDKIGEIIGSGGKTIKGLMERYGVQIDIDDSGKASVAGSDQDSVNACIEAIAGMIKDPQIGEVYDGEVTRVENYGAFVEFLPQKEALLHVSELSSGYISDVNSVIKVGDKLKVTISGFNDEGKIKLSAPEFKAAHPGQERSTAPQGQRPSYGPRPAAFSRPAAQQSSSSSAPRFGNFHPPAPGSRQARRPAPNRVGFSKKP